MENYSLIIGSFTSVFLLILGALISRHFQKKNKLEDAQIKDLKKFMNDGFSDLSNEVKNMGTSINTLFTRQGVSRNEMGNIKEQLNKLELKQSDDIDKLNTRIDKALGQGVIKN